MVQRRLLRTVPGENMPAYVIMCVSLATSFENPVWSAYLADPFCWYHDGTYYAIGTGRKETGRNDLSGNVIPLAQSRDLQHWESVGRILEPPEQERGGSFWAPEVAYHDGTFYLYYHPNGNGRGFHIRVATSDRPAGPYHDTGTPLTDVMRNPFAIDAHAFRDVDGQWYLFYATDFLDYAAAAFRGTALVVDRLLDMTRLEGNPRVVMRAHWPWQCYERGRNMGGAVADWYTLEGPTVRFHEGRYYCFYSGGCYQNDSYGVDYLVADEVLGPWQEIGRQRGPQVLRTVPGAVIGPGHNSIVASPDGSQDYIVYHAWNAAMTARLMCIDPLLWTPQGPVVERFTRRIAEVNARVGDTSENRTLEI